MYVLFFVGNSYSIIATWACKSKTTKLLQEQEWHQQNCHHREVSALQVAEPERALSWTYLSCIYLLCTKWLFYRCHQLQPPSRWFRDSDGYVRADIEKNSSQLCRNFWNFPSQLLPCLCLFFSGDVLWFFNYHVEWIWLSPPFLASRFRRPSLS